MLKESTILKGNLCIYKGFIDVLSVLIEFSRKFGKCTRSETKKRKHKMEFKDCHSEQKGLSFVEKD